MHKMSTSKHVRVAVVQAGTAAYSLDDTFNRLEALATKAASQGAELAVFPEARTLDLIITYP